MTRQPDHPRQLLLFPESIPEPTGPTPPAASPAPPPTTTRSHPPSRPEKIPPTDIEALRARLQEELDQPMESLTLTRNRTRIVSAKKGTSGLKIRIHRCFAKAGDRELKAVADFFANRSPDERQEALTLIREHFEAHGRQDTAPSRRRIPIQPQGRFHDLEKLRDRVNRTYFDDRIDVRITWGQGAHGGGIDLQHFRHQVRKISKRKSKQTTRKRGAANFHIRLGSYQDRDRLVRIHPVLDQADVPEYVVESIVYHEMLHQAVPPQKRTHRRVVHSAEFRRRERLYAHYEKAETWLAKNLERLARERF